MIQKFLLPTQLTKAAFQVDFSLVHLALADTSGLGPLLRSETGVMLPPGDCSDKVPEASASSQVGAN